ncbi:uncharacterized protein M421DRAFT_104156 [Didymella exigua CBS 183.55]|uniref:Uncharacterized protein n=1 Tax=Didymella exigua CBS 183.55 TaxID=1150837 RepID=A0A6A5R949_9PLEO|nr:uncharacterized protein M421DRAFT_104156 [Didymella exigua CBS 183.55]KAF1923859.1 hypothetical protein M421DRAFT_104156 [Didymella exigua CBS 183.55]
MCYHNFTQQLPILTTTSNGCGHIGESHQQPWTLCQSAVHRLNDLRGPMSPPLSPTVPHPAPMKRSGSTRRFFSLSQTISRSASSASRRTVSTPDANDAYFSPTDPGAALNYATLPDHQLNAVRCHTPSKRSQISREMDVCKECKRWIGDMRRMVERYDKTGSIRGTSAFETFLRWQDGHGGSQEGDLTVPLGDSIDGVGLGAQEAIILGHPEGLLGSSKDARSFVS